MATNLTKWEELNERQKEYLRLIYHYDQQNERIEKAKYHNFQQQRPASEWRWIKFDSLYSKLKLAPEPTLKSALRIGGLIDPGTGSTFSALESRGFIECEHESDRSLAQPFLTRVKLTKLGRAVARAGLGEKPEKKRSKGQLRERQWEALCSVVKEPFDQDVIGSGNYGGFSWRWTWLRLRDLGFVQEQRYWETGKHRHRMIVTDKGRAYYEENLSRYREIYPEITPAPAH